jgi:serine/threonine protein kinase/tetratricopeptide (TPR) repeat protein
VTAPSRSIKELFLAALEVAPQDRAAWLEAECAADPGQREHLRLMLAAHDEPQSLLDRPKAAKQVAAAAPQESLSPTIDQFNTRDSGNVIGPYKLIEQIGEGGMGSVWMAQQTEPVKRVVALKVIKTGLDSRQLIARFEAERQALALMDHPNIARVIDAGTTSAGTPYFVMELVKGVPITRYCDEHHLTPRQRLELFMPVCQAVQHAHQKGIIHRDLKPSNVLVASYDGRPIPKVIDFGVAKATGLQLTEKTLITGFGNIVGTLEYMSPEQAEVNQLDIDTRSDIYSLGVLLYELLTGSPPFTTKDLEKAGFLEILRVIREQEPSKPSMKLSTAEGLPTLAANRGTEPAKLAKLVRGELDWIVMKALEKDRNRRYETANGFAMDVQRYLADEPVQACPPSTGYRLHKFARRNRRTLAATAVVSMALVLGTIVSTWQAIRASSAEKLARDRLVKEEEAHKEAEANLQRARELVDEYFTLVSDSTLLDVPALQPLRKELLQRALKYHQGFVERRVGDLSMLADLAASELRITQIMYASGEPPDRFVPHLAKGVELAEQLVREGRATPEVQRKLAGYLRSNPDADHYERGKTEIDPEVSLRILWRAAQLWEKFVLENPEVPGFQSDLAGTYLYLAVVQFKMNRRVLANFAMERAVTLFEGLVRKYPAEPRYRLDLTRMYDARGDGFFLQGRPDEARRDREKSLALREQLVAEFPDVAVYRTWLARSYREAGDHADRFDEAEQFYAKSLERFDRLAAEFPADRTCQRNVATAAGHFGDACLKKGLAAEAARNFQKAAAAFETLCSLPPVHWKDRQSLVDVYRKSSQALTANRQPEEAELALRRAVAVIDDRTAGEGEIEKWLTTLKSNYADLIRLLTDSGKADEAKEIAQRYAEHLRKAAERVGEATPDQKLAQANEFNNLALLLKAAKLLPEAEEAIRSEKQLKQSLVTEFPKNLAYRYHLANSCLGLAYVVEESGRKTETVQHLDEADSLLKEIAADASIAADMRQWVAHLFWQLGDAYWVRVSRPDDAERAYQRAAEMFRQLAIDYPKAPFYRQEHAFSCWKIGWLLDSTSRTQEAEEPFRQGLAASKQLAADYPQELEYGLRLTRGHHELANVFARNGKPAEAEQERKNAVAEATRLIQLKPDRWEPWSVRASNYFHLRDWNAAIADYSKAIDLNSEVHANWWHRAHSYANLAQWDKAAADFKSVVDRWPDGGEGWYLLAVAQANSNESEQSIANLRHAIANDSRLVNWVKTDSRLDPLRKREDFGVLLKELK